MRIVEIRDLDSDALTRLKPAWDALLRSSASDTIFLTWEWMTAWWSSYGTPGDLRIFAAFDDEGVLRGIAPLRFQKLERYGQKVPALRFIGDGSNDSEYLDVIAEKGFEGQVAEALRPRWRQELNAGTVLLFNEMPETSPNLPLLKALAAEREHTVCTEAPVRCATVPLPATWEEYLSSLKPRFRTKVRSVLRGLEEREEIRFRFCESSEDIERLLPLLFQLHTKRWAELQQSGVFRSDRKQQFYLSLTPLLLERRWLRFSWIEWNGCVLACQYGFVYADTYFHLQEGYNPACEHWNVGVGLRAWSIREFIKQGMREYDFLGGVSRHKTDWGAETKHSTNLVMAGSSYKNLVFCHGPRWETRAREAVANLVPASLMAMRRAHIERRDAAALQPACNTAGAPQVPAGEWMRRLAASCYCRLYGPALARRMREQFELSISRRPFQPAVSWTRRTKPTARILFYHRINNDNDPFFPAMSTELFDRQMQFIARHHKVVSLASVLDCLEAESAEPVIAITFDDGYQDNYRNALPILQRYGLPATIFLTTGSIDSGEPLWFEKLADASKRTAVEFINLEIDIPRRFWFRTIAERLISNEQLFALMRGLSDTQRKQWLVRILRDLGVGNLDARRDQMLTWDQVRQMQGKGFDFGGHTVNHPFLSKLTREEAAWEARECKRRIEQELQVEAHYFAYPSGRDEDFAAWNKEVVRSAGYRAAVTTKWGVNGSSTDRMELRRGQPWEKTAELFACKLDWYELTNG